MYYIGNTMVDKCEKQVRMLAGTVVLIGLALGYFVSAWLFLIPAFAGANLLQSSLTDFCPAEAFLPGC